MCKVKQNTVISTNTKTFFLQKNQFNQKLAIIIIIRIVYNIILHVL